MSLLGIACVVTSQIIWRLCWRARTGAFTTSLAFFLPALFRWIEDTFTIVTRARALRWFGTFRAGATSKPSAFFVPRFGLVFLRIAPLCTFIFRSMLVINFVPFFVIIQIIPVLTVTSALATTNPVNRKPATYFP